ncbi:uncharacterized protein B0H18DRAFT_1119623 [Fomitopsis serialis]|uniref:uncharacterized protein n=1 Tax=Fomitopsis serialis TaxID=139415 RepID=UPI0020079A06|nr:uncharacterized protein B0H18DRAFT_1119623 [Neoantrodia serialis]KAH9925198.1 hypothetical protein B0H18DRAFT_1119623 [Neoantrodia serialis]
MEDLSQPHAPSSDKGKEKEGKGRTEPAKTEPQKRVPRQSQVQAQVDPWNVLAKALNAPVTLPVGEIFGISKEMSAHLQEVLKPKAPPKNIVAAAFGPRSKGALIYLRMEVDERPVTAIIDTGSQLNIASRKLWKTHLNRPMDIARLCQMNDANGGAGALRGLVENVPLTCGNVRTIANLYIGERVPFDLLLGRPWQRGNYVSIDKRADGTYLMFKNQDLETQHEILVTPDGYDPAWSYEPAVWYAEDGARTDDPGLALAPSKVLSCTSARTPTYAEEWLAGKRLGVDILYDDLPSRWIGHARMFQHPNTLAAPSETPPERLNVPRNALVGQGMPTKGSTVEPRTKASLGGDRKGGDVPKSWSPTATPGIGPTPSIERLGASVTQADQDKPPSQVNEAGRDREIRAVTRLPQGFTQSVRDAHRNEQATSETHPCGGRIHQCAPCPTTRLRAHRQGASANVPTRIPAATQHDETEDGTLVGAKKRDRDAPNQQNVVATLEANIAPSSERTVRLADGSFAAQPREKRSIGEDKQAGDLPDLKDAAPQLHGTTDMLAPLISLPFGMERPAKDALASRPTTGTHQINRNSEAIYAPSSTPSNSQSTRPDPIERSAHDPPLHQGPADVLKRVFDELVTLAREGIDPEDETGVGGRDRKKARRVNIAVDRDPRQSVALRKKKTRAEQRRKQQSRERLRSRAGELARKRARRPQTEVPAGTRVSDRAEPCNRDPDLTESTRPGHTTSNCDRAPDPLVTCVARSRATSTTPADSTTPGSGHEGHSLDLSSARTTKIGRGRIAGEAGVRQGSRDAGEYTCWPYKELGPRTLDDPSPASGRIHSPAMPPQRRGLLARYSAAPVLVQPSPIRSVLSVPPDLPRGYLPPRDIERIVDFDNHHGRGPSAGSMVLSSSNCTIQRAYNETDGAQRLVFHCQNGALAFQHANQRSTGVASFTGTVYGGSRVDRADEPLAHLPTENAIYGQYNSTLSQNGRRTVRPFEGTARCSKLKRQCSEPLVAEASGLEVSLHW